MAACVIATILYHFVVAAESGWSWGCVATVDSAGRIIWIADAYCDDGTRFVIHADEKLTAFIELEAAIQLR